MKARNKFLSIENGFKTDDPEDEIVAAHGPMTAYWRIKTARELERQAGELYESAFRMNPKLKRPPPPKKIPKGYFLHCLARCEQDEIRKLAKIYGIDFRTCIDWVIRRMKKDLKQQAYIAKLTGMKIHEQIRFFGFTPHWN